jgi:hypothetical protein
MNLKEKHMQKVKQEMKVIKIFKYIVLLTALTSCSVHQFDVQEENYKRRMLIEFNKQHAEYIRGYVAECPNLDESFSYTQKSSFLNYIEPNLIYKHFVTNENIEYDSLILSISLFEGVYAVNYYEDLPPSYEIVTFHNGKINSSFCFSVENNIVEKIMRNKSRPFTQYFSSLFMEDSCNEDMHVKFNISQNGNINSIKYIFNPEGFGDSIIDFNLIPKEYVEKFSLEQYK